MNEKASLLDWQGHQIEILRRPYQRSLSLKVKLNGQLRVTCGLRVDVAVIKKFILQSHDFIATAQSQVAELKSHHPRIEFVSGDLILYQGQRLPLEVIWSWSSRAKVRFHETYVELKIHIESKREERQKALVSAYKKIAKGQFPERFLFWSARMGLYPSDLSLRGQRTRWGSCSPDGSIRLNWKLVGAPPDVIDYVMVHELAHLKEPNHSSRFWQIVEAHSPEYRAHRRWLRKHQYEFEFLEKKSELHSLS